MKSKKSIFLISLLTLVGAALLFLLTTSQPFIKLIRFTVFNTFEFEGKEIGTIEKDIVYKTIDGEPLMVDLYMPFRKEHPLTPVVVFSHGGGFVMGDRDTMFIGPDNKQLIIRLRELGYAIANFDYRLLGETVSLANIVADNKDIVRWLRKNAGQYGFDPENIGIWGQSAGGYLALVIGLSDDDEFSGEVTLRNTSARVSYIVNNYGVADLVTIYQPITSGQRAPGLLEKGQTDYMFEASFAEDPNAFARGLPGLSAVSYIDRNDPPVLSVHGDADTLVNPEQSRILQRALDQAGSSGELHLIGNTDHIFNGATSEQIEEIVNISIDFIVRNTHKQP